MAVAAEPNHHAVLRSLRRIAIGVMGVTVLLIGLALVVLPGPAVIVIPLGLGILATEFAWAARLRERAKLLLGRNRARPGA